MAERVGFEPTDARTSPVFKTGSLNRSDTSPTCYSTYSSYHVLVNLSMINLQGNSIGQQHLKLCGKEI